MKGVAVYLGVSLVFLLAIRLGEFVRTGGSPAFVTRQQWRAKDPVWTRKLEAPVEEVTLVKHQPDVEEAPFKAAQQDDVEKYKLNSNDEIDKPKTSNDLGDSSAKKVQYDDLVLLKADPQKVQFNDLTMVKADPKKLPVDDPTMLKADPKKVQTNELIMVKVDSKKLPVDDSTRLIAESPKVQTDDLVLKGDTKNVQARHIIVPKAEAGSRDGVKSFNYVLEHTALQNQPGDVYQSVSTRQKIASLKRQYKPADDTPIAQEAPGTKRVKTSDDQELRLNDKQGNHAGKHVVEPNNLELNQKIAKFRKNFQHNFRNPADIRIADSSFKNVKPVPMEPARISPIKATIVVSSSGDSSGLQTQVSRGSDLQKVDGSNAEVDKTNLDADVRKIQISDILKHGMSDVRYNFMVGPNGETYEGRGWSVEGEIGSKNNRKSYGIGLVGESQPSKKALDAVDELIKHGRRKHFLSREHTVKVPDPELARLIESVKRKNNNPPANNPELDAQASSVKHGNNFKGTYYIGADRIPKFRHSARQEYPVQDYSSFKFPAGDYEKFNKLRQQAEEARKRFDRMKAITDDLASIRKVQSNFADTSAHIKVQSRFKAPSVSRGFRFSRRG